MMDDFNSGSELGSLTGQIRDALRNANGDETQIKIDFSSIREQLQLSYSLSNVMIEILERLGINLAYHDFNPATDTLTIQSVEAVKSTIEIGTGGIVVGDGGSTNDPDEDNTPDTFDAYVFTVETNNKTYRCYVSSDQGDQIVKIEDRAYYCKLIE